MTDTARPADVTDGPIHQWFSLSYTNYVVLPRTLLQSMPTEWQERMVACLNELHDAFSHIPQAEVYEVTAATEHIVREMTEAELQRAGIEFGAWRTDKDAPVYFRDGDELDPHARVLLPTTDPVPHYNRGRTYIAPKEARP
ncbi:hypothetical protein ACFYPN_16150 [Streptomyces sp. NPDC005576]|uniref:hypothetical protein n=1 Tax=unclassified Streptomyces TaxID=2593676 RepID=UPI0034103FA1